MRHKVLYSLNFIFAIFITLIYTTDNLASQTEISQLPNLIPYRKGSKMGFCDKNKNIVINCTFDETYPFSEGLARVKQNSKWGFIDEKGHIVVPCQYDFAFDFKEGFAVVKNNSKYGFINQKGDLVVPLKYEFAWSFSGGLAGVGFEGFRWGFINQKGKEVISHKRFYNTWDFKDGYEIVDINGYWSYYSLKDGIICCDFELNPWSFYGDYAIVSKDFWKTKLINKKGKVMSKNKIIRIINNKGYEFYDDLLKFDGSNIGSLLEILNLTPPSDDVSNDLYYPFDNILIRTLTPDGFPAYMNLKDSTKYWE